jgi:hypothetical protein
VLSRRRPVTEGARAGPAGGRAFDTPAPNLDSESTFGPG